LRLLEPGQLLASLIRLAQLDVGLAEVLARRRVVGLDREALVVGRERAVVVPEHPGAEAHEIPGLVVRGVRRDGLRASGESLPELLLGVLRLAVDLVLLRLGDELVGVSVVALRLLPRAMLRGLIG